LLFLKKHTFRFFNLDIHGSFLLLEAWKGIVVLSSHTHIISAELHLFSSPWFAPSHLLNQSQ
jgi:hypothetical protein